MDVSTLAFTICGRVGKGWGPSLPIPTFVPLQSRPVVHTPQGRDLPHERAPVLMPVTCMCLVCLAAHSFANLHYPPSPLQFYGLLRNPERHFQLLPLVEELLPLLLVTRDGAFCSVSEQVGLYKEGGA